MTYKVLPGLPYPLGSTLDKNGVNFALFSKHATRVELCLFDHEGKNEERVELPYYTDEVFHGYIPGLSWGQRYAFRVYGPYDPDKGMRFNPNKLVLDPYCKKLTSPLESHPAQFGYVPNHPKGDLSFSREDSASVMPKCIVVDENYFDWKDISKPKTPWADEVIYETHVRGFTALNPDVEKAFRGTFNGLSSKKVVEYLKSLQISAVELLPVASFVTDGLLKSKGLTNYWGYDPILFMAPHTPYLSSGATSEIKWAVRTLHEAGIEVILDVVYNHTAEGNQYGPTLCYRGIDNAVYYRLKKDNPRYYEDTTGCGASFNLEHPRVLQLVMDSLRYWANSMQIDGFRFDLATTLARDDKNTFTRSSDFLSVVQQDPVLQRLKLIAEPWDLGNGGYQVGTFRPGWAEWNDQFRDTVRRFWRGEMGQAAGFAERMLGSPDLYNKNGRKTWESVNFITAHDGFSLCDLVSYNTKHNQDNKEDNKDGRDDNCSWNGGVEGPTNKADVLQNRFSRAKGLMSSLLLSMGTPMIRSGDEVLQSNNGNNNLYAQDNKVSWTDWGNVSPEGRKMLKLVQDLMAFRRNNPILKNDNFLKSNECVWFRPDASQMRSSDWEAFVRAISCRIRNETGNLFFIFNGFDGDVSWQIPAPNAHKKWKVILSTEKVFLRTNHVKVPGWSVIVLKEI
ncbi:MAG: glycogen debranching protein GlgX [Alphaproteobacteria bacterium]|nr:glycogen debranching protein GlgX [Alphaproteobacteria bacterium]